MEKLLSIEEFINKWNKKFCDFDKAYGNQCFDLFRQYCKDVLGFTKEDKNNEYRTKGELNHQPDGQVGAKNLFENYYKDDDLYLNFEIIPYKVGFHFLKGDVIIWKGTYGPYGHVALNVIDTPEVHVYAAGVTTFSQNDPAGFPCFIKDYVNFDKMYGVLRPRLHIPNPSEIKNYHGVVKRNGNELWGFRNNQ